jgi:hypothetical protein
MQPKVTVDSAIGLHAGTEILRFVLLSHSFKHSNQHRTLVVRA